MADSDHSIDLVMTQAMTKLEISDRHEHILGLVRDRGFVSVTALARSLNVSEQTARRDLVHLADQGLVAKVHGGAGLPHGVSDTGYDQRIGSFSEEKARIGSAVAAQIPEKATIFIDIGTTMEAVAKALLRHKRLTVVTNHLTVASILSNRPEFQVMLAGGHLRQNDHATTGEATRQFIEQFRVGYGIFGIGAINSEGDLLDFSFRDIGVSATAMRIAQRKIFAVDHSKFDAEAVLKIGHLSDADMIVTDRAPPRPVARVARRCGVETVIAKR